MILLILLLICSPCFASYLPDEATASVSVRSPHLEGVDFDYEAYGGVSDSQYKLGVAFEREDGEYYNNFDLLLRTSKKRLIHYEASTKEKPAQDINRQSVMAGMMFPYSYKELKLIIGYGAVTDRYILGDIVDAFYFRLPLPGRDGNITLTTDFDGVLVWSGFTEYVFPVKLAFKPFVKGEIYIDDRSEFYQVKVGVKYCAGN